MVTALAVDHDRGRDAFLRQLAALTTYVDTLGDDGLLAPSRCRGWVVGDVVAHVHLGLQEMFLGLASPSDGAPDVDAGSYWRTQPVAEELGESQFAHISYVRTLFSALRRPSALLGQWRATTLALARLVAAAPSGVLDFQSYRLSTGDFLGTWAVELAVHHLDLRPDGSELAVPQVASDALRLARETIEALLEEPLPPDWSDQHAVLIGTGRVRLSPTERERLGPIAAQLPALG